jgi:hypothetical protein
MNKREVFGTALVGVGIVGVLLPVVPGFPFLLAAVAVLGPDHRLTRPVVEVLRRGSSALRAGRARLRVAIPRLGLKGARRTSSPATNRPRNPVPLRGDTSSLAKRTQARRRALRGSSIAETAAAGKPQARPGTARRRRSGATARAAPSDDDSRADSVVSSALDSSGTSERMMRPTRRRTTAKK